ncbi:hypothetical protein LAB1_36860 [Roseibium sp. LAB1]
MSGGGHLNRTGRAFEQLNAEFGFQALDLLADGGLGAPDIFTSGAKALPVADGNEGAQDVFIH